MTAGETMNLIIIMVLMGTTQSVMYIAPALNIKMGLRVRLFLSSVIQILVCLIETLETLIVQVLRRLGMIEMTEMIMSRSSRPS